jgi:hypothetical protein
MAAEERVARGAAKRRPARRRWNRSQTATGSDRRSSAEERGDGLAQALLVARGKPAEGLDDERLLECREHGLDGRGLEKLRGLPILHDELAEGAGAAHLARVTCSATRWRR